MPRNLRVRSREARVRGIFSSLRAERAMGVGNLDLVRIEDRRKQIEEMLRPAYEHDLFHSLTHETAYFLY